VEQAQQRCSSYIALLLSDLTISLRSTAETQYTLTSVEQRRQHACALEDHRALDGPRPNAAGASRHLRLLQEPWHSSQALIGWAKGCRLGSLTVNLLSLGTSLKQCN
jgi:hypothetical protein